MKQNSIELRWSFSPLLSVKVNGQLRTRHGKVPVRGTLIPETMTEALGWIWRPDETAPSPLDTITAIIPEELKASITKSVLSGLRNAMAKGDPFKDFSPEIIKNYPKAKIGYVQGLVPRNIQKNSYLRPFAFYTYTPIISWDIEYRGQTLRPAFSLTADTKRSYLEIGEAIGSHFRPTRRISMEKDWIKAALEHIHRGHELIDNLYETFPEKDGYKLTARSILSSGDIKICNGTKTVHFDIRPSWQEPSCYTSNVPQSLQSIMQNMKEEVGRELSIKKEAEKGR